MASIPVHALTDSLIIALQMTRGGLATLSAQCLHQRSSRLVCVFRTSITGHPKVDPIKICKAWLGLWLVICRNHEAGFDS